MVQPPTALHMNLSIDKGSEEEGLGEEVFILGLKTEKMMVMIFIWKDRVRG